MFPGNGLEGPGLYSEASVHVQGVTVKSRHPAGLTPLLEEVPMRGNGRALSGLNGSRKQGEDGR